MNALENGGAHRIWALVTLGSAWLGFRAQAKPLTSLGCTTKNEKKPKQCLHCLGLFHSTFDAPQIPAGMEVHYIL